MSFFGQSVGGLSCHRESVVRSTLRFCALCAIAVSLAACGGGAMPTTGAGASGTSGAPTSPAQASAVYLESDPYPLTGTQPDHFVVGCDSGTAVDSPAATDANGARYLHFALSGFSAGAHTCIVAAADASNSLSSAVNISFNL